MFSRVSPMYDEIGLVGMMDSNCENFVHHDSFLILSRNFIHFNSENISADGVSISLSSMKPGRVAQSVGHPTHKSGVLGSIPGLATYFRFSFRFFKKGSCQLLAKVCARSTG